MADDSAARSIFRSHCSMVVVAGLVLGMSKKEVMPPASAARLSVAISPLFRKARIAEMHMLVY